MIRVKKKNNEVHSIPLIKNCKVNYIHNSHTGDTTITVSYRKKSSKVNMEIQIIFEKDIDFFKHVEKLVPSILNLLSTKLSKADVKPSEKYLTWNKQNRLLMVYTNYSLDHLSFFVEVHYKFSCYRIFNIDMNWKSKRDFYFIKRKDAKEIFEDLFKFFREIICPYVLKDLKDYKAYKKRR